MSLLEPTSVAVIGASAQPGKVGHDVLKNLTTQGYKGPVYPVNPKGGEILGLAAFATITDVPGPVDMAVIVTPAPTVIALADECGRKGVKTLVVISAGFKEVATPEGLSREKELAETVRRHGMTLVGANCLGVLRPSIGFNASFAKDLPPAGSVALLSQSGALAVALMDAAPQLHMGFSSVISMGNKTAHDECDFLAACAEDPQTRVIGLYLESIPRGGEFRRLAAAVSARKPIVLLKSGTSSRGQRAVSSHTGSLAGSDAAVTALCRQAGVHRAKTAEEFLDLLKVLSTEPPLPSPNVAVITNAGGPGILATDAAERESLTLVTLAPQTLDALKAALPEAASSKNPVDVLGDAGADRYRAAVAAVKNDPEVDGLAVLLTPQVMTPVAEIATALKELRHTAPLLPIVACFMGGDGVTEGRRILEEGGVPTFDSPERAMRALAALRSRPKPAHQNAVASPKAAAAAAILAGETGLLSEEKIAALLALYELPAPAGFVATTVEEAVGAGWKLGFPVIAKISSPDILHKTDVGGIRANLKTEQELASAVRDILASVAAQAPQARIRGVLVQQFLPVGNEFIVGGIKDPSFGPLLMAGLGGIYTELFRDTAFRLCPVDAAEAYGMLQELKSWKLLLGMRGKPQSDIDAMAGVLQRVAQMLVDCPGIVELDLNPVFVSDKGVTVADAKIVLEAV